MIPREWTGRVWSVLLAAAGIFVALCLITFSSADVGLLSSSPQRPTANLGGAVGAWIGLLGRGGFGWASLLIPLLCFLWAWRIWQGRLAELHPTSFLVAGVCLMGSAGTLLALQGSDDTLRVAWGWVTGFLLARAGGYYLGAIGTVLTALCAGLLSWLIVFGQTLRSIGQGLIGILGAVGGLWPRRARPQGAGTSTVPMRTSGDAAAFAAARDTPTAAPAGEAVPPAPRVRIRAAAEPKPKRTVSPRPAPGGFQLPSLDLLASPPPVSERQLAEDLQVNAKVLGETLRDFRIGETVANIDRVPTVTRYELTTAPGVKINKIVSLSDDLALVLKAVSCHVVAPIPGKGRVGVDVPNATTTTVTLKELLCAPEFQQHPSVLALPIGKDVSGQVIITDLREGPHLLTAVATGSGKTVSLNSLLVGILSRASPEQVQFLMIDPKMVELAMFNDIPHLAAPVVTNAKKASAALHWAVQEMERRYQLLAKAGVRNIDAYNARAAQGRTPSAPPAEFEDELEDDGRPLPYLVLVIDELADLMIVASQDVEGASTRLAQLSRAVGLHMILATQRPSVDVITGVIKANFPARIALQVASKVDSRTILDMNGADKL